LTETNLSVGTVEIFKGTVGEIEQQPRRKLEQLDAEAKAIVNPVVVDETYAEARAEVG